MKKRAKFTKYLGPRLRSKKESQIDDIKEWASEISGGDTEKTLQIVTEWTGSATIGALFQQTSEYLNYLHGKAEKNYIEWLKSTPLTA